MDNNDESKKKRPPNPKLHNAREERGWTHKDVADRIGAPDSHMVSRWERGASFPSAFYRQRLSKLFEKSLEELGLIPSLQDAQAASKRAEMLHTISPVFTSFVGRKQEVDAASNMLLRSNVRLLTLLGTGGIGKTRLGIEVAALVQDRFADSVCSISLVALRDDTAVFSAIASILDIQESNTLSPEKQIKAVLRERQLLLLLDNVEHVMSIANFIEELLQECPRVKVLVTSREVLQIQAEHRFVVPPLSLPDLKQALVPESLMQSAAVSLFMERAQSHVPMFTMTASNASAIAELCVRLDGLPLAIELAAPFVKLYSPQTLLAKLSQDMHLLKSEVRTVPERHRTLYYTIKWSYELLSEQEQWVFRHLAVFVGGALLATIEECFAATLPSGTLIESVQSLMNKSLLQRIEQDDEEPRFLMLETIRSFALDCLQDHQETDAQWRAYALYYLALVERAAPYLKKSQQPRWLATLEREHDNLRAALQWLIEQQETELALRFCEAFGKFCGLRGYWHEERRWLKLALQLPGAEQYEVWGRVLRRAGHLAYRLREPEAHTLLEQSVTSSRVHNDLQNLAGALSGLAWVLYRKHEEDVAGKLLMESKEVAYQSGDHWVIANTLESVARFLHGQGEIEAAYALLQESLALARQYLDEESLARILTSLVALEIARNNTSSAMGLARESVRLARRLGTKPLIALTLDRLGDVVLACGEYAQAQEYFEERIGLAREIGDEPSITKITLKFADIALREEDLGRAKHLLEEACMLMQQQDNTVDMTIAWSLLEDVKRAEGDAALARSIYQRVLDYCKSVI